MNFSNQVLKVLDQRQFNFNNNLTPGYHEKRILKSVFDSSTNFFSLIRNYKSFDYSFCFSPDGNFMISSYDVWKVTDDLKFSESTKVLNYHHTTKLSNPFTMDSKKVVLYNLTNEKKDFILAYDLVKEKEPVKYQINTLATIVTTCYSNSNIIAFSDDSSDLYLLDLRCSSEVKIKENNFPEHYNTNSLEFNPINENLLLVNLKSDRSFYLFDIRNRQPVFFYDYPFKKQEEFSFAKYNRQGDQIFLISHNLNPLLFNSNESFPVCEFDEIGYLFNCNISSNKEMNCCFIGPYDEYVVSPSNSGNVYLWEIPSRKILSQKNERLITQVDSAKHILKNLFKTPSVAYNYQKSILACIGFYETCKFWSPLQFFSKSDYEKKTIEEMNSNFDGHFSFELHHSIMINSLSYILKDFYEADFICDDETSVFYDKNNDKITLEKNLVINYFKSYINNYEMNYEKKKAKFKKKLKDFFEQKIKFDKKVLDGSYSTLIIEIYKFFCTKIFIKKTVVYLKKKLLEIDTLVSEIENSDQKVNKEDLNEKIVSLDKTKLSINLILKNLKEVYFKENEIIEDPYKILERLNCGVERYKEIDEKNNLNENLF